MTTGDVDLDLTIYGLADWLYAAHGRALDDLLLETAIADRGGHPQLRRQRGGGQDHWHKQPVVAGPGGTDAPVTADREPPLG
jgi:hypothetical protein